MRLKNSLSFHWIQGKLRLKSMEIAREAGKLDWSDRLYMITNPIHMRQPHLFPKLPSSFEEGMQSVKMIYCPKPEVVMGIIPHSDGTLLLQVNGVDGLEINKRLPVRFHPDPDALVVNIGDILEIFSNGVHRSIEPRVVYPIQIKKEYQ
ncbi:hypothetical protein PTKIN_Ptkin18bG0102800 [Pterospermum kingtungense]